MARHESPYIKVVNAHDDPNMASCPRCYGKRSHPLGKMWYQILDGEEILVCDRCHKTLYYDGHTEDFGIRWFDKKYLAAHPEIDEKKFRERVKIVETAYDMLDSINDTKTE